MLITHGVIEFEIRISKASEFKPPRSTIRFKNVSSVIRRFTSKGIIAVFMNYDYQLGENLQILASTPG